jgi:hypothetical protein
MKKTIKATILGLLMVPMMVLSIASTVGASPASDQMKSGAGNVNTGATCLFTSADCADGIVTKGINTALFVIGALAVIMLIYGGIRYTISAGDSKQVEAAKNTILYAIIGIIIALLAGAIVNFVLTNL